MYEDLNSGIYHIWIDVSSYFYLGSTKDFDDRKYNHLWLLENNKHKNTHLQNAYNKHKTFHFEVAHRLPEHYLLVKEQYLLDTLTPWKREIGYNVSALAHRPEMNEETRKKISESKLKLGESHPSKRPEVRAKMSEVKMGESNPSKRLEVRAKKTGEKNSSKRPEVRAKMSEAMKGKNSILAWVKVCEIRKLRKENSKFYTYKKLGEIFGLTISGIQGIIENRSRIEQ
mgnify:CR=1 FL=1